MTELLHDDADAVALWCAEFDGKPDQDSTARFILSRICLATKPVWKLILSRLHGGTAALQTVLLTSLTHMRMRISSEAGQQPPPTDISRLGIDLARWEQLWYVLHQIDPARLGEPQLLAHETHVIDAAEKTLAAASGMLDSDSEASRRFRSETATSFGQLITGDEQTVQRALGQARQTWHVVSEAAHKEAIRVIREQLASETEGHWPWAALLVGWFKELLAINMSRTTFEELYTVTRTLTILAGLAEDKIRECASADHELPAMLAETVSDHRFWTTRLDAALLLGVLRHASQLTLDALLNAVRDIPAIRDQALWALQKLEGIDRDQDLLGHLFTALYSPSGSVAWAAGQVLAAVGQSTDQLAVRQQIITALARAIVDPRSERPVHLSFAGMDVPGTPQLDDAFAEALSAIYRSTPGTLGVSVFLGCSAFRVLYVFLSLFSWWCRRRAGMDRTRVSRRVRRGSTVRGPGAGRFLLPDGLYPGR